MDYNNFSMFDDSYDPTKSNVLGDSLTPTAGNSDQLPAMDFQNDQRTPYEWKQDARQANIDADPNPDVDSDSMYVSQAGNKYQKVTNSRVDQMMEAVTAYLTTDLATDNPGQAAMAAGKAVYNREAKAKRFNQIDKLESTGRYNDIDIAKWIDSGDNLDLTRNQGKWQNMGNGIEANTLTGESRQIAGYQPTQQVATVNSGDQVLFYDKKTGHVVNQVATGAKPATGVSGGGSIGLDDIENGGASTFQDPTTGQWFQRTTYANGREHIVPLNATAQKSLQAKEAATQPTAAQSQMNSDLDTLETAVNNNQVGTFTGQIVGRSETAQDALSSTAGTEQERSAYQAARRVQGSMQNQGVGAARDMGLSGINTIEEAKRAFASMPQLDYTSAKNLENSIKAIKSYVSDYNAQKQRQAGVTTQQPQQPSNQPKSFKSLW